jgi:hypothetical protein
MPLDGKIQRNHRKRVCAKDVTTLFSRSILSCFQIRAQLGAFSFGNRTKFSENGRVDDVTFEGTFVWKRRRTLPRSEKNIIGREADKTAFSTKLIEIYLPNNGLHGIMENA